MFIKPIAEELENFEPDFVVYNASKAKVEKMCIRDRVRIPMSQGWYPNGRSMNAKALTSQRPIYPVHATPKPLSLIHICFWCTIGDSNPGPTD